MPIGELKGVGIEATDIEVGGIEFHSPTFWFFFFLGGGCWSIFLGVWVWFRAVLLSKTTRPR